MTKQTKRLKRRIGSDRIYAVWKTAAEEIKQLCAEITREIKHWEYINQNGCNDPFWADGCNMNLTRNHIIYGKRRIEEICEEHGIPIPEEMYLPTPPEVDNYYMAHLRDKKQVERVAFGCRERIVTKRNKYDRDQLSLF